MHDWEKKKREKFEDRRMKAKSKGFLLLCEQRLSVTQ